MSGRTIGGRRVLKVRVKPRSSTPGVVHVPTGEVTVFVHAPPEKGQANREAVRLLASHFGMPVSCVRILRGAASRVKLVEIAGPGGGKG